MASSKFSFLLVAFCLLHFSNAEFSPTIYFKKQLPKVPGAYQCGGPGEFVELRYAGCGLGGEMCEISADDGLVGEMDYVPIKDIDELELKIYVGSDGNEPQLAYEGVIPESEVEAGHKYTVSVSAPLDEDLVGEKLKARFEIYDPSDESLRICMEAEVIVIE